MERSCWWQHIVPMLEFVVRYVGSLFVLCRVCTDRGISTVDNYLCAVPNRCLIHCR